MRLVKHAQEFISDHITEGSIVLDLTSGNGHDSLYLAKKVGEQGKLYAIDIQKKAIQATKELLSAENCLGQTRFILSCHTKFPDNIPRKVKGKANAIMLNLGYLPKGDHQITTKPETTIETISYAYDWLDPEGVMTIIAYRGHSGGQRENLAVSKLISDQKWYCEVELGNEKDTSPILYMIRKLRRD